MGGRALRLGWVRGLSSAAIPCFKENIVNYLGKCTSGKNCHFLFMGKFSLGKMSFGKLYIWEVTTLEIAHLRSCYLGKYPWEVDALEKVFGKVPNILDMG